MKVLEEKCFKPVLENYSNSLKGLSKDDRLHYLKVTVSDFVTRKAVSDKNIAIAA